MTATDDIALNIVRAIAAVEGVNPHELDYSLHEHVSTDAVRSLAAMDHDDWELTFEVPDHTVTVDGRGAIGVDGELIGRSEAIRSDEPR
ncbi:HalOD1 output domain-containing protein [Halosimplex halophilum]|uniref:HalOD1 output domain-containing protein n=1 Tax=Halosimplex halophilum TaxID=2559572 RepID=UPI001AE4A68B|nr:HalOD1 output domain-containing protein [Halosimplex halophilum]